jgi:hypothetical protein
VSNYTYQHDPRISGADFEDEDDYDYSLVYPDMDEYCPECKEVLSYVLRDGVYGQMCNHCGWPHNKEKKEEAEQGHE